MGAVDIAENVMGGHSVPGLGVSRGRLVVPGACAFSWVGWRGGSDEHRLAGGPPWWNNAHPHPFGGEFHRGPVVANVIDGVPLMPGDLEDLALRVDLSLAVDAHHPFDHRCEGGDAEVAEPASMDFVRFEGFFPLWFHPGKKELAGEMLEVSKAPSKIGPSLQKGILWRSRFLFVGYPVTILFKKDE